MFVGVLSNLVIKYDAAIDVCLVFFTTVKMIQMIFLCFIKFF